MAEAKNTTKKPAVKNTAYVPRLQALYSEKFVAELEKELGGFEFDGGDECSTDFSYTPY